MCVVRWLDWEKLVPIRFFSNVCSHVRGQVPGLGKTITTLLATKRFFSSMCSHVIGQVPGQVVACSSSGCWQRKIFFHTFGNSKFFSSMCSHVIGQVPGQVVACASSGCWQRKIFFHTFGNNNVFLQGSESLFPHSWQE